MAFTKVLVVLASYICTFLASMLFPWTVYYAITRTDLPPGFKQRVILQTADILRDCTLYLGEFLDKLGICNEFALLRLFFDGIPSLPDSRLLIKDLVFDDVPVRVYWPKTPVTGQRRGMLYIHGGAGVVGSIRGYERICRSIARESDSVVASVGYGLAPEHSYLAGVNHSLTAAIHFLTHAKDYGVDPHRIIIGGDSLGATSSAIVTQELVSRVDLPRLRAQILIYPFLQMLDLNLPSYQQYQSIPILSKKLGVIFLTTTFGRKVKSVDAIMKNALTSEAMKVKYSKWISADLIPAEFKAKVSKPPELAPFSEELYEIFQLALEAKCCPLLAEDAVIQQLPETFLLTCKYDMLRDDGLLYKKRLEDNGVPVTWHHVQDGFHGMLIFFSYPFLECQSAKNSLKHIIQFLEGL